jgi:tRNA G18 (ribose-2'-O)-methylase SpoU
MGSLLRLPVFGFDSDAQTREALSRLGFRHVCARVHGGVAPEAAHWGGRVALWVGSETGRDAFDAEGFETVTSPMAGRVESLNVTVAASILLYFAGRERAGTGVGT